MNGWEYGFGTPAGYTPTYGSWGITPAMATAGFGARGSAFLPRVKQAGLRDESYQALKSFLLTPRGRGWVESLTPAQVAEMLGPPTAREPDVSGWVTAGGKKTFIPPPPIAGFGPNLPYLGAGWPTIPAHLLPSAEAPYGYGVPWDAEREIRKWREAQALARQPARQTQYPWLEREVAKPSAVTVPGKRAGYQARYQPPTRWLLY